MPFVKLDTGILRSTLWFERDARELFITALLMAEPYESQESIPVLKVDAIEPTGFVVPPGWYGFVPAAGIGIIRQAGMDRDAGMKALADLGSPDTESRSSDFEGRRLVRVDGGYIVLNYMKYRDRDNTVKERMRRYRQRQKELHSNNVTLPRNVTANVTIAEAEAEADINTKSKARASRFLKPSVEEVRAYLKNRNSSIDAETFWNFYESKNWRVGDQPMKNWHAAVVTWEKRERGGPAAVGVYNGPAAPEPKCKTCNDLGKLRNPRAKSGKDLYTPCPDCGGRDGKRS